MCVRELIERPNGWTGSCEWVYVERIRGYIDVRGLGEGKWKMCTVTAGVGWGGMAST